MKLLVAALTWLLVPLSALALEAHKIAELKGGSETLGQFLKGLPTSFEAQVFYGLMLSGVIGMMGSWLWKWTQGIAHGIHHFTAKYTVGQLLWLIGSSIGAIETVGFQTDSGEFFGWMSVIVTGGFMGFSGEVKVGAKNADGGSAGDPAMVRIQPSGRVTAGPGAAIVAALALGTLLALGAPSVRAQAGNLGGTILGSAARTAAQVNSADQQNLTWSGATVIVDVTAFTAGTYTPKIQGKDPASGKYYDILTGTAIGGISTNVLKVYPGITAAANAAVSDVLPRVWRVQLNGAAGQSMTFSVGANLQQ